MFRKLKKHTLLNNTAVCNYFLIAACALRTIKLEALPFPFSQTILNACTHNLSRYGEKAYNLRDTKNRGGGNLGMRRVTCKCKIIIRHNAHISVSTSSQCMAIQVPKDFEKTATWSIMLDTLF